MSVGHYIIAALLLVCSGTPQDAKPNIVFILADDLGINELSCYGRKDQPTPHLDRLASEGIRFTSAYCAQPICSPSRAALMTGLSPARLHLTTFLPGRADAPSQMLLHPKIQMQVSREEVTIAERLKEAGYATACVGKWHLGGKGFLPTDQGFDVYHPGQANTAPSATEGGKGEVGLTAAAEKFVEENKDRPFYLYLPHNNPHIPLAARVELIEKHKDAFNPVYAAVIEELDNAVGRLMAKLEAVGVAGRTVVVFTSDNGGLHVLEMAKTPATHNTPFRAGKGFTYEGGLRIPLLVRWPGKIKAGMVTHEPVINTDWVPTLLEMAGVKAESKFDGASFAGLLLRGEALPLRPIFWHYPHYTNQGSSPTGAVREGDWKLIEHYEDGRLELFNLAQDISETNDLSAREPARVAALRGKLEAWRREMKAQGNTGNPAYNPSLWKRVYRDTDVSTLAAKGIASEMAVTLDPWRKLMNEVLKPATAPAGGGAVILHARDAKVTGTKLRYEPEPHKDTLGFWTDAGDRAEWSFDAPGGTFEVVVLQGCGKGSGGSEVEVSVAGQAVTFTVEETGHFQRFIPRTIGTVKLEKGPATLSVRAKSKPGVAVMDLRRIVLRAAP